MKLMKSLKNWKMNKLLPILIVVVLSGFVVKAKSPLENCADYSLNIDYELTQEDKELLVLTVDELYNKYRHSSDSKFEWKYKKHRLKHKLKYQHLNNLSLEEKIKNKTYKTKYQKCEQQKKMFPLTFYDTWKWD